VLSALASLVAPLRCASCGVPGEMWCDGCRLGLELITGPRCAHCGAPTRWPVDRCRECRGRRLAFATAWAAVAHRGAAAVLVRRWKDGGLALGAVAAETVIGRRTTAPAGCLCPVPGDPGRMRRRGVDPPGSLAAALSAAWSLPVRSDLVRRVRPVPPQRGLDAAHRRRNLARAFAPGTEQPPASVVLIDDVYTTGATADACARVLRRAGAERVEVVTFARALRR
jgi:predicted amidophosphoribosyltransferase